MHIYMYIVDCGCVYFEAGSESGNSASSHLKGTAHQERQQPHENPRK